MNYVHLFQYMNDLIKKFILKILVFLIFILFILPFVKYFQLKGQEERILKEGISRVYTEKEFTTPRRKILDRNSIELATDIRRDTFIFSSNAEKEKIIEKSGYDHVFTVDGDASSEYNQIKSRVEMNSKR